MSGVADECDVADDQAIHSYFSLSYDSHLVRSRSMLQSMPPEWQRKFVALLREFDDAFEEYQPARVRYAVQARDGSGRYAPDPVPHYNRGRTYIANKASLPT